MKNIFGIITILLIASSSIFSQSGAVKKAIRNGKTSNFYYEARMSSSSLLAPEKLEKWYKSNKRNYYLIGYTTQEKWAAGKKRKLVSSFTFVKANELSGYNEFKINKLKEKARSAQAQARQDQKNLMFLAGAFLVTSNVLGEALKSTSSSSSSSSDYSSSDYSSNENTTADNHQEEINDCISEYKEDIVYLRDYGDDKIPYYGIKHNLIDDDILKYYPKDDYYNMHVYWKKGWYIISDDDKVYPTKLKAIQAMCEDKYSD